MSLDAKPFSGSHSLYSSYAFRKQYWFNWKDSFISTRNWLSYFVSFDSDLLYSS